MTLLNFIIALALPIAAWGNSSPDFECRDLNSNQYQIWLGKTERFLKILPHPSSAEKSRSLRLAVANLGRPNFIPGDVLVYNGWSPSPQKPLERILTGFEFTTQYKTIENTTVVFVSLVIDHKEITEIQCTSRGNTSLVATPAKDISAPVRNAQVFKQGVARREKNGTIDPLGVSLIETSLRRMGLSPGAKDMKERSQFLAQTTEAVTKLTPTSVKVVTQKLEGSTLALWTELLKKSSYDTYPETQRYIAWITEAMKNEEYPDTKTIALAFSLFRSSSIYASSDLRNFFKSEISGYLKVLKQSHADMILADLNPGATKYFKEMWGKASGKKTLSDYSGLDRLIAQLKSQAEKSDDDFNPSIFHRDLINFFKSSTAQEAEARALFVDLVKPSLEALSLRQREDLRVFFSENDKGMLNDFFPNLKLFP